MIGHVYFARGDRSGLVKIGHSAALSRRTRRLASKVHEPVTVLAAIPGSQSDERALHSLFAALRVDGEGRGVEWFRDDGRIAAHVAELPETQRVVFDEGPSVFGDRLRSIRLAMGFSLRRAAVMAGVTHSTWQEWETGVVPAADVAVRVARVLGETVESIWGSVALASDAAESSADGPRVDRDPAFSQIAPESP